MVKFNWTSNFLWVRMERSGHFKKQAQWDKNGNSLSFPLTQTWNFSFSLHFFWIIRLLASQRYFYLIFSIHWCFAENVIIFILILSTDIDGLLIVTSWTDKNVSNDFSEFTTNTEFYHFYQRISQKQQVI